MTAFCMVRWRFPCGLLPISMIDIQRCGPLSVPSSGLNSQRHVLRHATLTTTEMYVRVDPTNKLEAIEAIVPPHLSKAPFDSLTNSTPCSEAARNGDHKAL